jgi:hypothetical protein
VLNGLEDMYGVDGIPALKVGYGTGNPEYPVVGPAGKSQF